MYSEPTIQLAFMALLMEVDINLTTNWDKAQAQIEEDPRFLDGQTRKLKITNLVFTEHWNTPDITKRAEKWPRREGWRRRTLRRPS